MDISGNTTFIGNSARWYGGAIFAQSRSNINIISGKATFVINSASNGGGVSAVSYSIVDINGTTYFIGNSARRYGGAIFAQSRSNINIISGKTTFVSNSASNGGGVSAVSYSIVNFNGTTYFIGNSAIFGGGLYTFCSNVKTNGNMIFTSNSAVKGGCIFLGSSLSLEVKTSFTNCSANDGSAIYAIGIQVNFSSTNVFSTNRAAHF